ncbi:hypothetical protein GCM10007971_14650 [Oceanobacillus indicireducens]|uniref:Uncharacterized protein n=1 Tax=Oceanobacillus indicireducens TaxID=1004261 RepID=A0A917XX87_9BACI|nr:hypothetical protein GCM10007971_14650 [Oceanobacillus indicireducens]
MFNTSCETSGLVISIFLIKAIPHLLKEFVKQYGRFATIRYAATSPLTE